MNTLLKNLLLVGLGAVASALPTWFLTKRKYEKEAEADIDAMAEYYAEELVRKGVKAEPADLYRVIGKEEESDAANDIPKDYSSNAPENSLVRGERMKKAPTPKVDYTGFYGKTEDELAEMEHPTDEYYNEGLAATKEMQKPKAPKFIKAVDFGSDPSISTISLLYYQDSQTLVIEDELNEEIIEDMDEVEEMIGDALTKYGFDTDDEPVIYIRNENRSADYEITKIFGAYDG